MSNDISFEISIAILSVLVFVLAVVVMAHHL